MKTILKTWLITLITLGCLPFKSNLLAFSLHLGWKDCRFLFCFFFFEKKEGCSALRDLTTDTFYARLGH